MTDYKLEIEEARTLFWEKMSELVIEYELYNFDPNIKEMERDLMEAYDKSAQALTHLIETEKKKTVRVVELQARANAYYESADWCKEDPRYYKHFWDKRKEALAKMKELQGEV